MSRKDEYTEQVRLLIRGLPIIAKEECFAPKGGTAINLFYRPLPRLSVDADLLYLPMEDRKESIANIKASLARISSAIKIDIPGARVQNTTLQQNNPRASFFCAQYFPQKNMGCKGISSGISV